MIDQIKKHQMQDALDQMQLTKKFDTSKIADVARDFQFLTQTKSMIDLKSPDPAFRSTAYRS